MATLRCTQKLLKRLGLPSSLQPTALPANRLGDWYANVLYTRNIHVIVLVSERTLLPVLMNARGLKKLPALFTAGLRERLSQIGVSPASIDAELERTVPVSFGRTVSRSMIGCMNDFVFRVRHMQNYAPHLSPFEMGTDLCKMPCEPLGWRTPGDLTIEVLESLHPSQVSRGGAG